MKVLLYGTRECPDAREGIDVTRVPGCHEIALMPQKCPDATRVH